MDRTREAGIEGVDDSHDLDRLVGILYRGFHQSLFDGTEVAFAISWRGIPAGRSNDHVS